LIVSVITVTYNRAATIVRALSSVRRQTYSNIQLVVIDGASQDETVKLVGPLMEEGDILHSEPDNGIYDALNKGVELSCGDVIGLMHSDDFYFDDNVLSSVMDIFSDENVDIVYGDVCFFSTDNENKIIRTYRSDRLSEANLTWGKMPAHPAMFIRRRVYEEIGYFKTDFRIAADYDFLCRLVRNYDFNAIYLPRVFVRMQVGGVSTGGLKNTLLLNKEVYRALSENKIYSNIFMILSKYPSKILQFLKK
jgi:glycosyltransferase involved in cell wall biosynthesis